jgi:hypothetical protein
LAFKMASMAGTTCSAEIESKSGNELFKSNAFNGHLLTGLV